ncbi:MAG: hypothetical protein HYR62_04290 [Actinobacteria bacterium]|nr:hypothetical protein [Actinomycetota bacterium]MBI3685856.1 hypothetical protein [Actinomycetota bacterium]
MVTRALLILADSDVGKSGPLGLLVTVGLGVAVYFLYRSMNRHVKNVPDTFDGGTSKAGDTKAGDTKAGDTKAGDAASTSKAGPTEDSRG